MPWMARSFRRLVVYNVDPETIARELRGALYDLPGVFEKTLRGYEDRQAARGVTLDASSRFRTAVIEAYGADPDAFIGQVEARLARRLVGRAARPSAIARIL